MGVIINEKTFIATYKMLRRQSTLAVLLVVAAAVHAACRPIAGTFRTQALPCNDAPEKICNYGTFLTGDLTLGYVVRLNGTTPTPDALLLAGRVDYTDYRVTYTMYGGQVQGIDRGYYNTTLTGKSFFHKEVTFTGGTGCFNGVTGGLIGEGPIEFLASGATSPLGTFAVASGTYAGTLCGACNLYSP